VVNGARHGQTSGTRRTRNIRVRAGIPRARFNASRKGTCARSLTGFFANSRSESRLYASVLTGLMCTHSLQIPVVLAYASLGVRSQNSCKLRVSCRVPRAIPRPPIDKTGFGPEYGSGRNASGGFQIRNPSFLLIQRVSPVFPGQNAGETRSVFSVEYLLAEGVLPRP
jgi:hypothetical protein